MSAFSLARVWAMTFFLISSSFCGDSCLALVSAECYTKFLCDGVEDFFLMKFLISYAGAKGFFFNGVTLLALGFITYLTTF